MSHSRLKCTLDKQCIIASTPYSLFSFNEGDPDRADAKDRRRHGLSPVVGLFDETFKQGHQ